MNRGFHAVPTLRRVTNGGQEESSGPLVPIVLCPRHADIIPVPPLIKGKTVMVRGSSSFDRMSVTEKLDQKFLNQAPITDPLKTDIFAMEKAVLYRGVDDALLSFRYLNASGLQSIEMKYYNESTGLGHARPFLIDFQVTDPAKGVYISSLRRGPMVVNSNQFASLGVMHKDVAQSSGLFSFFLLIDAAVNATPSSAKNTLETFIGNFENI